MTRLQILLFRLRALLRSRQLDRDIDDEIASHLAEATDEYIRQGLSPEDARRAARRSFGGVTQALEVHREVRSFMWLDDLSRDLRHALRTLRRTPVFAAVALLTLALGIGANAAIFSVLNGVILRPLPYPKPEQVMYVTTQIPGLGPEPFPLSAPEYLELRQVNRSFAAMGAFMLGAGEVNLTADDRARRVRNVNVDEHLLEALGLQAAQGRLFRRGETARTDLQAPLPPVAILSHELWQTAFGGQPVIGKIVEVNPSFPREMDPTVPVARVRDMEAVFAESIQRPRLLAQLLGVFGGLALLLAAVGTYGVVSSIVAARRSEIAIRMALGADQSSVLADVLREGLRLAIIGVAVGLAGAFGLNRLIAALLFGVTPTDVPTVVGVAATMIIVAAVACVLPAWRASRLDPIAVLRA